MNTSDTRLRIAAIIAVHNRLEFTQKCLSSLSSASNNHEVTVILVDDGSTDGTADWVASNYPYAILLHGDGNLWFGGATQMGIDYALDSPSAFDFILTINNDTFLLPDSLDIMVSAAGKDHIVAATYSYTHKGTELVSTAGYLWRRMSGWLGVCHTPEWISLQANNEFVNVDSVTTTATLFPTKFLLNSSKISLKMHPHHRYDVMLSASCRGLGAKFITSTQPLAVHIYSDRSDLISYKNQSLREFWIKTFQDPLQVDYLPGVITAFATSAPSRLQALPIIFKCLLIFLYRLNYVVVKTLVTNIRKLSAVY